MPALEAFQVALQNAYMGNDMVEEQAPVEGGESGLGDLVLAGLKAIGVPLADMANLPVVVARNLGKVMAHLGAIPKAYIDGVVAEINATTEARVGHIKSTGKAIAKGVAVPVDLVAQASEKEARRILRQHENVAQVLQAAVNELRSEPYLGGNPADEQISDDWLNLFEQEAGLMSSAEMHRLFGKILAGEIRRPSSYSRRTVRLLAELDNRAAAFFKTLCSLAIVSRQGDRVDSAQVADLADDGRHLLHSYGLPYDGLMLLQECGLILQPIGIELDYTAAVRRGEEIEYCGLKRQIQSTTAALAVPEDGSQVSAQIAIAGVSLSTAGKELYDIVDKEENPEYTSALRAYLNGRGLDMKPVAAIAKPVALQQ